MGVGRGRRGAQQNFNDKAQEEREVGGVRTKGGDRVRRSRERAGGKEGVRENQVMITEWESGGGKVGGGVAVGVGTEGTVGGKKSKMG